MCLQEKARKHVQQAVINCRASGLPGALAEHVVRINGFESGMLHDDLEAIFSDTTGRSETDQVKGFPHAIMMPKCESVEQLMEVRNGCNRAFDDLYLTKQQLGTAAAMCLTTFT